MGFYAPHTLIEDAKRHGVEVRGADVTASGWEYDLEGDGAGLPRRPGELRRSGSPHAVRGLPRAVGEAIVAARATARSTRFRTWCAGRRLSRAWLLRLAEAGALGELAGDRRSAVWRSLGLEGGAGGDLFAGLSPPEPEPELPESTAAEEISADYATTGLSVRGHPMAVVRPGAGEREGPHRP